MKTPKAAWLVVSVLLAAAAPAAADSIPKATWVARMRTALPTMLCQEGSYFRSCFRIEAEECENAAASSTRVCLKELEAEIPDQLKLPDDGQEWGRRIGACAGGNLELVLLKKKVQSEKCNDPAAWQ